MKRKMNEMMGEMKGRAALALIPLASTALAVSSYAAEAGGADGGADVIQSAVDAMTTSLTSIANSVGSMIGGVLPIVIPIAGVGIVISVGFAVIKKITNKA